MSNILTDVLENLFNSNNGYSIVVLDDKTHERIDYTKVNCNEYLVDEVRMNELIMRYEVYASKIEV